MISALEYTRFVFISVAAFLPDFTSYCCTCMSPTIFALPANCVRPKLQARVLQQLPPNTALSTTNLCYFYNMSLIICFGFAKVLVPVLVMVTKLSLVVIGVIPTRLRTEQR